MADYGESYDPDKVHALMTKVLAMKEGGDVADQSREKAAAAWEGLKQMYEEAKDRAASENVLEGLKGTARSYTTDVLGTPVDLLTSLPVAPRESGNPYANAIRNLTESLGETPVGGSDWLAQKLGLYGEGLAHEAGRMFGPGAVKVFAPEKTISRIFAGERAATADLEAKKLAEKMLEEGAAPEDVWAKTGWGKGPEGKWRFEIPDWEARTLEDEYTDYVKDNVSNRLPFYKSVSQVFEHPELASAYPDVSNMDIVLRPDKKGGSLSQNIPEWATPTHPLAYTEIEAGYDPLTGAADKSVLLHELQHAVQQMEGSALGGSPKLFYQGPMRSKAQKILEDVGQTALNFRPMSAREVTESLRFAVPEKLQEALQKYGFKNEDELKKYLDYEDLLRTPFGQYQRLAGEAEARLTQAREKMSPGMRRVTYPWNPEYFREQTGVPLEDLIYRYENEGPSELIAYHGTPHRFPATERNPLGEFDASKIGTGEGAQAYGHGIYLAESPGVAGGYRDKLAKNEVLLDGEKVKHDFNATDPQSLGLAALTSEPSPAGAAKALRDAVADPSLWGTGTAYEADLAKQYLAAADWLEKNEKRLKVDSGSFYKVDLPDEMIDRMLDWDKPLSEQGGVGAFNKLPKFARPLDEMEASNIDGERLYKRLVSGYAQEARQRVRDGEYIDNTAKWADKQASEALRKSGIPGIKYLDQLSRDAGEGTRNFVIFPGEEKNLNILERKARGGAVDYDPDKIAHLVQKVLE